MPKYVSLVFLASIVLMQAPAGAQTPTAAEQQCAQAVQGNVAWNRAGSKNWGEVNLRNVCKGTTNVSARISCFQAQIQAHDDWARGIAECAGSGGAVEQSPADFYTVMVGDTQIPRVISQFDVRASRILKGSILTTDGKSIENDVASCVRKCDNHPSVDQHPETECNSFTYVSSTRACEMKNGMEWADGTFAGYTSGVRGTGNGHTFINEVSEAHNKNFVKSVNTLAGQLGGQKLRGIVVNGDLTEFGQAFELGKFKEVYNPGNLPATLYPGLGNHDYSNNVNDCAENNCANRMVLFLRDEIRNRLKLTSFDFKETIGYQFPSIRNVYEGSLAYSWDINNVHFVQLNFFPGYNTSWESYVSSATPDGSPGARTFAFKIKSSMEWLRADLYKARRDGKAIILNFHDPSGHWAFTHVENGKTVGDAHSYPNFEAEFNKLVSDYDVSAVFAAHIHGCVGRSCAEDGGELLSTSGRDFKTRLADNGQQAYGSVPWFYSGSPMYNTYVLLGFTGQEMTVERVYSSSGAVDRMDKNAPIKVRLKTPRKEIALPPTDGWVTFFNEAGYVSRYTVTYLLNGIPQTKSTGNVALGNKVKIDIPAAATTIQVMGEGQTGLLDSPVFNTKAWNNTFFQLYPKPPQVCFKSFGTTLNQKWDNNCQ